MFIVWWYLYVDGFYSAIGGGVALMSGSLHWPLLQLSTLTQKEFLYSDNKKNKWEGEDDKTKDIQFQYLISLSRRDNLSRGIIKMINII